ncbi:MFS transporter [Microbacterium rhizophilus]|uniref:MFS transporter n=1 Tax=Microbacterium rhizophilus TaxID=3138934 RepID=UPI0031E8EB99
MTSDDESSRQQHADPGTGSAPRTRSAREVLTAISGLIAGMFVALISSTVVSPSLPVIVHDLDGDQSAFTWIVTVSMLALILIQKTLHLPKRAPRPVKIDYLGSTLIAAGVILLLLWVSLAGTTDAVAAGSKFFEWVSVESAWMVGGSLVALVLAVIVELKVSEPIIPLQLFKDRTFTLAVISSIAIGVAMFGTSIFLSQYMQLARGANPTQSGLMTLPMIIGQMGGGIVVGQLISRYGKWKGYVVAGGILTIAGLGLMGTISYDTNFALVSIYMFLLGLGVGLVMQNVVLAVQNSVAAKDMGAASAGVTFFRTLGGTLGVTALGAVLAQRIPDLLRDGLAKLTPEQLAANANELQAMQSGTLPSVSEMDPTDPIRVVIESAYGQGIAEMFLVAVPLAVIALIAIAFLPNKQLSQKTGAERLAQEAESGAINLAGAMTGNDSPEAIEAEFTLTASIPVAERPDDTTQHRLRTQD